MKKQKVSDRKTENHIRPNDFDFDLNRGREVSIHTHNNRVKSGILYGLMPDDIVVIKLDSRNGIPGISETEYSEIKSIILR